MNGTIAITDFGWYSFLSQHPELHEVNFWTPSPRRAVRAEQFSPFFFKLKAPHRAICGFALFASWSPLPDWLAWEYFGTGNGTKSFKDMRVRIEQIRQSINFTPPNDLKEIGCTLLVHPIFFTREQWIRQPIDWPGPTQTSKKYDLTTGEGERVWRECLDRMPSARLHAVASTPELINHGARFGTPSLVTPRLGQGTFRVAVLDAYGRACAVTGEHSLPAIEAAHIQDYADDGPHAVENGLLLRADLHRLFDAGYLTVNPQLKLEVSDRLRLDYQNGKTYYPLHGKQLRQPIRASLLPNPEFIRWHNEHRYNG